MYMDNILSSLIETRIAYKKEFQSIMDTMLSLYRNIFISIYI